MATTESPNLTRQNFTSALSSIDAFLTAFGNKMGDRFRDSKRDSIHLTSPGWQALGVLYHDLRFKLSLNDQEIEAYAARAADIDWSRYNPDWVPMLGQPEIDKVTNAEVTDSQGRTRVAIQGAGRSNVQNILDYLRRKLDLADRVSDAVQGEEVESDDL